MRKIKFIGNDGLAYALFKDKIYTPIYESEENYLVKNEVNGNSIVPKCKFIVIKDEGKDYTG
ncbi:hypothetical protein SAMN05446037_1006118 [Anaerovirgula multivorans]|uniref:Uncharacterized protein n=1 Tax=Anaerovirgula multivorans TaxID=312168 RepID=A0A239CTX3_9FIRM|nr:hypothetical protein [Anaerovirgula multivorans]SNS22813.1 hypothetical protein SAMN05446037_1006118 [Anaerovirgula multivorans]